MTGSTVLHYRIGECLGVGGMGEVYLAEDTRLGRTVALKFLKNTEAADEVQRTRLLREARAASSLRSSNIAAIYDVVEHSGTTFIVMEYVAGEPIAARIARGPLAVRDVVQIGHAGGGRAGRGALARRHPPRHQERQPDRRPARPRQTARLRPRQARAGRRRRRRDDPDGRAGDGRRHGDGHVRLHVAGTGARADGGLPVRPVLARRRALRDADGPAAVRGRARSPR